MFYQGGNKNKTRLKKEAVARVKLLPRAVKLLKLLPIPQEESSYVFKDKKYRLWAFEGIIEKKRIKVIVRQVGNGQKHFWSIIPAWRKTRFGRKNARGNLAKQ